MPKPVTHFVADRMVWTYQPDGWPRGMLTGYLNQAGGFVLEHVVAFPGGTAQTLVKMLRIGMEEAWTREYPYIVIFIPADHPDHPGLTALAKRCGFKEYATSYWVAHRR